MGYIFIILQAIFKCGLKRLLKANVTKNNSTPMNHTQPNSCLYILQMQLKYTNTRVRNPNICS